VPVAVIVCVVRAVVPRVSIPLPSDFNVSVVTPDCAPSWPDDSFNVRLLALVWPAASVLNDPMAVSDPVVVPNAASSFSVKPSAAPLLPTLSATVELPPTCWLPKFTSAAALAVA
jgi:hypothetical protein